MLLSAILFANNLQKSKFKLQNIKKLLKQKRRLMFQIFFIFYYLLDLTFLTNPKGYMLFIQTEIALHSVHTK